MPFRDVCGKCGATRQDQQIGLEPTVDAYVAELVAVFREVRRVLTDDGTLWVNLGSSYGAGKQLIPVPWLVGLALQQDGWILRKDNIWSKANAMPESVTDRTTTSHEYVLHFAKRPKYYYDAAAIAEPTTWELDGSKMPDGWDTGPGGHGAFHRNGREKGRKQGPRFGGDKYGDLTDDEYRTKSGNVYEGNGKRNKRSVWTVATHAWKEAHYATFPPKLIEPCIRAGSSERGQCPACRKPWVRVVERTVTGNRHVSPKDHNPDRNDGPDESTSRLHSQYFDYQTRTVGWAPSCACGLDPIPDVVLDPFGGSGTTGMVCDRLNRDSILIELSPANCEMARKRIVGDAPLFATVEVLT
jgi:DNA modification methylase